MVLRGTDRKSTRSTGGGRVHRGLRAEARIAIRAVGAAALLALAPACTNLRSLAEQAVDSVTGADPLAGLGEGSNTSGVVITRVQLDTFTPSTTIDLIGDGSGSIGAFCQDLDDAGTPGKTTCTCAYSYILGDGTQIGPIEVDTTYRETNMLRCPYTAIPAGVKHFDVYVHLTNSDTKTNTVTFQLGSAAGAIDLSNPESFLRVQRYQCRDIVTIPMWDGTIYNPFLSEDPRFSYPLNFYTTNMGDTFARYAADTNAKAWNCPAMPNDTASGMDLTLYSVAADASGSKGIFPPSGSAFDRSTFYVAKSAAGVFNIPVNAYVYPTAVSSEPPADGSPAILPPPLGYGASPIPLSGGGETCPDASVTIPSGYHWAKLWLFRKQLPQRAYPVSNALSQFGSAGIACNSPKWDPNAPDTYFTDCTNQPAVDSLSLSPYFLAARFSLATAACFNVIPGGATEPVSKTNYDGSSLQNPLYPFVDFTPFAEGTDIWRPANQDPQFGCSGTASNDLSHACQASTGNVPYDATIPVSQGLIDSSTANPRFDYLFVVSPPSVNREDMVPTAPSTTHSIYTPMRFMTPTDCTSDDPDNPAFAGDCDPSRLLTYDLIVSQAGMPGQTGSADPNAPGIYPMCVLQPDN